METQFIVLSFNEKNTKDKNRAGKYYFALDSMLRKKLCEHIFNKFCNLLLEGRCRQNGVIHVKI